MALEQLQTVPLSELADEYYTICEPGRVNLLARGLHEDKVKTYGLAHAFIGCVKEASVIGSGSLVVEDKLIVHGLSTGNYSANIRMQLAGYEKVPEGGYLDEELCLLWGHSNFGHWLFTYLLRLTLLWYRPELRRFPLLINEDVPRKYLEWLERMGLRSYKFAGDGVKVRKLWVPSVLCYRGQLEDMTPYIYPEAVYILRHLILKDLQLPRFPRTRLYISRARAAYRKMDNENEVTEVMKEWGIERVFMEELTLDKQLDLISRAELIVIHAGGGSPITMLAPMDCRIIELTIPQFIGTFASVCWAHILGQPFHRIDCRPTKKTGPLTIDMDSICPVEFLRQAL